METTNQTQVQVPANLKDAIAMLVAQGDLIADLQKRVAELESQRPARNDSQKEMTDDDARNILFGECKDLKHNAAASKLGLSYGQVYSCRLEYTFKHIHKEMKEKGIKNQWAK